MLRLTFCTLAILLIHTAYSQVSIGKVKIDGKPENAIIKLEDSVLNRAELYTWPQGIFKLQISAEGYENYYKSYFQVYKDRVNYFDYKLKKYKEPKLLKTAELLSPVAIIPLTYVFADALFPTTSLEHAKSKVEDQKGFVLLAQEKLENDNWQNDITLNQEQFESAKEDYERAVEEHNDLVKRNNRNNVVRPLIVGVVAATNFYYLYSVYKKRKKARNDIGLNVSPNYFSLSIGF